MLKPERLTVKILLTEPNQEAADAEADAVAKKKAGQRGLELLEHRTCIDGPSDVHEAYTEYEYTYWARVPA